MSTTPKKIDGNPLILCHTQDETGMHYFGTSRGVLQFDGTTWKLHPTPTSVRALGVLKFGTILVGGAADFGVLALLMTTAKWFTEATAMP